MEKNGMKICPKCEKIYDNSWGVCINCDAKLIEVTSGAIKEKEYAKKSEGEKSSGKFMGYKSACPQKREVRMVRSFAIL